MFEIALLSCFTLFVLGIIALIAGYGIWFRKRLTAGMTLFSGKFGFETEIPGNPVFGYPSAHGNYGERPVKVYTIQNKSFDMHDLFTIAEMDINESGDFSFCVRARNFIMKFDSLLQPLPEITTGDENFDRQFIIKTNEEKRMRDLIDPELKKILLDGSAKYPYFNLSFDGSVLKARRQGTFISENVRESVEFILPLMSAIAGRLKPTAATY